MFPPPPPLLLPLHTSLHTIDKYILSKSKSRNQTQWNGDGTHPILTITISGNPIVVVVYHCSPFLLFLIVYNL